MASESVVLWCNTAGREENLLSMYATLCQPAASAAHSVKLTCPPASACHKLMTLALAQKSWRHAAALALALHAAMPLEAQAGLAAALNGARGHPVVSNTKHIHTTEDRASGGGVETVTWLREQVRCGHAYRGH